MQNLTLRHRLARAIFLAISCFIYSAGSAETLAIPGSGNPQYLLNELARVFNERQTAHTVVVPMSTGSAGAIRDVANGTASLGRVGRPLKDEEKKLGLSYLPLGRDAVVFVAGAKVTANNISRESAIGIFEGKIKNWQELGGAPGMIRAIGRERSDSSIQSIQKEISAFGQLVYGDDIKLAHLDHHLLELLDRYPYSFGFLNKSALLAAKTPVVILNFESTQPTTENLSSGRYRLWIELGLIYKKSTLTKAAQAFMDFVQSPEGAQRIREYGILPVTAKP